MAEELQLGLAERAFQVATTVHFDRPVRPSDAAAPDGDGRVAARFQIRIDGFVTVDWLQAIPRENWLRVLHRTPVPLTASANIMPRAAVVARTRVINMVTTQTRVQSVQLGAPIDGGFAPQPTLPSQA